MSLRGCRLAPLPERARLWKRKKPNSLAGNFPPGRGSSCAPPTPLETGLGPTHSARGRGGGGERVVLVRVRQHFHFLNSVGSGVYP